MVLMLGQHWCVFRFSHRFRKLYTDNSPALRPKVDHAAQLFDCSGAEETTLEANPDDLTAEYLGGLLEAGIDRLSIGVQSLSLIHIFGTQPKAAMSKTP